MRARNRTWLLLGLLGLLLVAVSPAFGRAEPEGSYRPDLPADALTNGCWPLPGGAVLDLPYQVRTDDVVPVDGEQRRELRLHYDLLDEAPAREAVVASFERAGFTVTEPSGPSGPYDVSLVDAAGERVDLTVAAFADPEDDPEGDPAVVRGLVTLLLPPTEPSDDPACASPFLTKRFAPDADDYS